MMATKRHEPALERRKCSTGTRDDPGCAEEPAAQVGFAGGAVIVTDDGTVQRCPVEEVRVWNQDVADAISEARARLTAE